MKIKIAQTVNLFSGTKIEKDTELTAIKTTKLWFEGYEVTEGEYKGCFLHPDNCQIIPEGNTYTEKEWNDMENHYMKLHDKEREQKERAQELVKCLTKTLNRKNALLEIAAITIEGALRRIKELEKAQ